MDDPDTFPPALSERPDCGKPAGCVCPADEPCHYEALDRNMPEPRPEVEQPRRG